MITYCQPVASTGRLQQPAVASPQWTYVGTVRRDAHVPGAFVRDPNAVVAPLAVTLRRRDDPWNVAVNLDQGWGYQWQDQLNEPGAASVILANDDPDLREIHPGDRVLYEVEGFAAFTMLPQQLEIVTVSPDEEAGQHTTVSGPGTLALLESALVYPSRGLSVWPIEEDRIFSWPAPDYNDSGWGYASEMAKWSDATYWTTDSVGGSPPAPSDWPDSDARWIWASGTDWRWAPDGYCYVRRVFTVPDGCRKVAVYVALDWTGQIYFDGQSIGENTWEVQNTTFFREEVDATPGDHTLAIECLNDVDPEGDNKQNPGGILCAVYAMGNAGEGELLVHSDSSWRIVEYPPFPPGMTPGEAMLHCISEAKSRGFLPTIETTFTNEVDSAGAPWPVVGDIATKVGTDLLTFFRELSQTYIDFAMSPAGDVLYAWASGTRGVPRPVTLHPPTNPKDPTTGNLGGLTHTRQFGGTRRALVRWSAGWSAVDAASSEAGREVLLGLGAVQSVDEMQRVAHAQLNDLIDHRTEIAADVVPMGLDDMPVLAYMVGDLINVPNWDGTTIETRVLSIAGNLDENARLSWAVELKDRLLDERERTEQSSKKMINGTLRGSSKVATPVGNIGKRQLPPRSGGGDD